MPEEKHWLEDNTVSNGSRIPSGAAAVSFDVFSPSKLNITCWKEGLG